MESTFAKKNDCGFLTDWLTNCQSGGVDQAQLVGDFLLLFFFFSTQTNMYPAPPNESVKTFLDYIQYTYVYIYIYI